MAQTMAAEALKQLAAGARANTDAPTPDAPPPKPRPAVVATGQPASELIDQRIVDVAGWRGETLARMRTLIREADPAVTEEWKWDVPVWSHERELTFVARAGTVMIKVLKPQRYLAGRCG